MRFFNGLSALVKDLRSEDGVVKLLIELQVKNLTNQVINTRFADYKSEVRTMVNTAVANQEEQLDRIEAKVDANAASLKTIGDDVQVVKDAQIKVDTTLGIVAPEAQKANDAKQQNEGASKLLLRISIAFGVVSAIFGIVGTSFGIYSYFNPRIVERPVEYPVPDRSGEVKGQEPVDPNGDSADELNQGEEALVNPDGEGSETTNPPTAEELDEEL